MGEKVQKVTVRTTVKELLDADWAVVRPLLGRLLKKHLGPLGVTLLPVVDGIKKRLEDKL